MDSRSWPMKSSTNPFMAMLLGEDRKDETEENVNTRAIPLRGVSPAPKVKIEEITDAKKTAPPANRLGFEFVDMHASTEAERERNRARIRSRAAMKTFRKGTSSNQPSRQKNLSKGSGLQGKEGVGTQSVDRKDGTTAIERTPSLGRMNPFCISPTDQVFPYADFVWDHSATVIWPPLLPAVIDGKSDSHRSAWLERAVRTPLAFHCLLYGGLFHLNHLRKRNNCPPVYTRNSLYHRSELIRLMSEELKNPVIKDIDEVLVTALILSTHETNVLPSIATHHNPFSPPFPDAQWISLYGSIIQSKAHTAGIIAIVKMRGGLDNVEWPGLADIVYCADIIGATQDFRHPYFSPPKVSIPRPLKARTIAPIYTLASSTIPMLGVAFTADLSPSLNIPPAFFTVMTSLIEYTSRLEVWSRGIEALPSIFDMTSRRNILQHSLVSLPTGAELAHPEGTPLYESLRLGTLLFSAAVIFPLPPVTGIFHNLVVRLVAAILQVSSGDGWDGFERTCLWLCVLGGIASDEMVERRLFLEIVSDLKQRLGLETWPQAVVEMKRYLWFESACDSGGRAFWAEVVARERSSSTELLGTGAGGWHH